jgi:thiol-disulfide isomerase/thioredoxin
VTEATSPTTDDGAPDPTSAPTSAPEPKPRAPLPKVIHAETNAACGKGAGVGQSLRDFDLPLIGADGKRLSKRSLRGKVSLVNLWGTWCEPCKKELPEFARLYRHYRGHGLSFVAIATDADPAPVEAFAKSRKLAGRFAYDGEPYSKTYGERSFPFTFVVDRRGTIVAAYDGYKEECLGQLEVDLRTALEAAR